MNGLLLLGRHFAVFEVRCTEVFNSGDLVVSLVVADQLDLISGGPHQRQDLPGGLQVGLAEAPEGDATGWVDLPDHCTCLSADEHAIFALLVAFVHPAQDGDADGVDLAKDRVDPRC